MSGAQGPGIYTSNNYVVLDFETTNLDHGAALNPSNRLVFTCWMPAIEGVLHSNWSPEHQQKELLRALAEADFIVAHNAKFELQWLDRCGFEIGSKPVWCTMAAEWVLAGNRPWRFSLDACLARRDLGHKGTVVSMLMDQGVCPSEMPRPWLARYGKRDVLKTHELFLHQREEVLNHQLSDNLMAVVYTRCLPIPALADIELNGMCLDGELVTEEYDQHRRDYIQVMQELEDMTGGINPRSPVQVAQFVYGKLGFKELTRRGKPIRNKPTKTFPDGAPKVDAATLLSLDAKTKEQARFLELKQKQAKLSAALDKNLAMFRGAVAEKDSMLYATLNQCRTGTHRLSSSGISTYYQMFDGNKGCQFQNLPNQFKKLFRARKDGWLFCEVDYAQLEYRGAGIVTADPVIKREVAEGFDVHKYTASIMNDVPVDEVTYAMRRAAKSDTFKPVYGGTRGTPEQERYYKAFQEKYHVMHTAQLDWCIAVENDKYLCTPWGMVYYWPNAKADRSGYLNVKTQVFNYPLQGFATAEIVPTGLAFLWRRMREAGLQAKLVNTVHDSVEVELPENEIELFVECAVKALTTDVYKYMKEVYGVPITIPLGLGMTIGSHWGVNGLSDERWKVVGEHIHAQVADRIEFKYDDGEAAITVPTSEE